MTTFHQLFDALQTERRRPSTLAPSQPAPSSALFVTHGPMPRARVSSLSLLEPIPAANDNDPCWDDLHRSTG